MERKDATYERLRAMVADLPAEADASSRTLSWATEGHVLALARDPERRVEVFVAGLPLLAESKIVGDLLEHDTWAMDDGGSIEASRVVLPVGDHFDQFAALLCVEMIENGLAIDAQAAFSSVEPLIELALTRDRVTDLTLMGLIGELSFLRELLENVPASSARDIVESWAGSAPSARDFQLGAVGVEVKTTQGASSTHSVEGVHQVELGRSNKNVVETDLFMLSLGLGWVLAEDEGTSLPELVDTVVALVPDPTDRTNLVARIKQYGGDSALGYDHDRDRYKPRYATRFYFRFERLYDLTDERLKLLSSAHLAGLSNIDPGSVAFRVVFDDRIRGEINPVKGWPDLASAVLAAAGYQT